MTTDPDSVASDTIPPRPFPDPPRHVPLSLRLGMLFGGFHNVFGWFFFGFGMIFYWVFAAQADFESFYFTGDLTQVRGRVTAAEKMNYKVNKKSVYGIEYEFQSNGQTYRGKSFSTGVDYQAGRSVTIEHPTGTPERSRIEGTRNAPMPIWCVFVAIFPLVGLLFFTYGFRHGRKVCRLLAVGESSMATLVNQEPTNTTINKRRVIRFHYEFPAADHNIYAATASTHHVETLANEQQPLLYDPANPGDATLIAHLPNKPEIDENGQLKPLAGSTLFWTLFLPTVSLVGHGGYALWRLASSL
jgi:hypothetical protein